MSSPQSPPREAWVRIARLVRPQGRHGEIAAEILTDFPERFATTREAFLAGSDDRAPAPVTIERSWLHKGRVVLKLAGVDSISAAEALRGREIVIPTSDRVPLDPGAAYIDDLTGCQLVDSSQSDPRPIGAIEDVIRQDNAPDLLVIRTTDGRKHWVPFANGYQVRIDLETRRVEMHLPAGILEIDSPEIDAPGIGSPPSEEERPMERPSQPIAAPES